MISVGPFFSLSPVFIITITTTTTTDITPILVLGSSWILSRHIKPPADSESYQQSNCLFYLSLKRNWDQLSRCIRQAFP